MKIYLAGAMTGVDWDFATSWRDDVIEYFCETPHNTEIKIFNPCFCDLDADCKESMVFDLVNLRNSDVMICNWDYDSIGTAIEVGVAIERNIPILVYTSDPTRMLNLHPWIKNGATKVFPDLDRLLIYLDSYFIG